MYRARNYFASDDKIKEYETYRQLVRVVDEQIKIKADETGEIQIELKDKKEVSSGSLQSPHDEDATYRKKGEKQSQGYGVTIAETCHEDNRLQLVTDVIVEPNNKDDAAVLLEHFDEIIEGGETKEIIGDGLYLTEDTEEKADEEKTVIVTTAIRGRKVDEEKLNSTDFQIENGMVKSCPAGKQPVCHESKNGVIKAVMSIDDCANCPLREQCPVRLSRKRYILEFKPDRMRVDR
jgi:hypothetical protein